MNQSCQIPDLPLSFKFESTAIFKQLNLVSHALAECQSYY